MERDPAGNGFLCRSVTLLSKREALPFPAGPNGRLPWNDSFVIPGRQLRLGDLVLKRCFCLIQVFVVAKSLAAQRPCVNFLMHV